LLRANFLASSGYLALSKLYIDTSRIEGTCFSQNVTYSTRAASFKVIINTLKHLPKTKLDAAFGIPALVSLYAMRILFDKLSKRYPRHGEFMRSLPVTGRELNVHMIARTFFFISIMRNGFVLIVLTLASFLLNREKKASGNFPIRILQDVPRGFQVGFIKRTWRFKLTVFYRALEFQVSTLP
jgi:sodium-independent sulfate anion transporter 11